MRYLIESIWLVDNTIMSFAPSVEIHEDNVLREVKTIGKDQRINIGIRL